MRSLFERCLGAMYIHTPESGEYAIEVDGDTLYLLFQWSQGREDWRNNFDFPARPYKGMSETWLCHRGFARVWKAMRDEIAEKVALILATDPEIERIVCVGYSHGGALAVFATEDMAYRYGYHYGMTVHGGERYEVKGYGFGAPRVVWGIVPKSVRLRLKGFTVVRNIPDMVTHVPPAVFGFRHVGKVQKVGKFGKYTEIGAHYPECYLNELKED